MRIDWKLVGAALCSAAAIVLAFVVITGGSKYTPDDKKTAWATFSSVLTFWLGVAVAK